MLNESTNLFRENAVRHLRNPEQPNVECKLIYPSYWMWLLTTISGITSFLAWAILGNINFEIEGQGIVLLSKKIKEVEKQLNQAYQEKNAERMFLKSIYGEKLKLYKMHHIALSDLQESKEKYFAALYAPVQSRLQFADKRQDVVNSGKNFEILVFVERMQAGNIKPDMQVNIYPAGSLFTSRPFKGWVTGISKYPVTKQIANEFLANINLTEEFFVHGAPYLVKINFKNAKAKNADQSILNEGSFVLSRIIWKQCSLFHVVFPQYN